MNKSLTNQEKKTITTKPSSVYENKENHPIITKHVGGFSRYEGARGFAFIGGVLMITLAVLSFIVPSSDSGLPYLRFDLSYGLFANFFPMNIINKFALLIIGIAGIQAAKEIAFAKTWSEWVFVIMGIAAILGLIPLTQTFFGFWPLFGGEVWAHATFALMGAYFGFRKEI